MKRPRNRAAAPTAQPPATIAGKNSDPTVVIPLQVRPADLYAALRADARSPRTELARVRDVADLARFLSARDPAAACAALLAGGPGTANALALAYRRDLQDRKLSAATINRRISTVRKLGELARRFGLIAWALDIDGVKVTPYRDTAGPGLEGWRTLLLVAGQTSRGPFRVHRDPALLRLLHDNALRRGELVALDLEDLDLDGGRVAVLGKGRTDKEWLTLNGPTIDALRKWVYMRGPDPGALFTNPGGGRLTGDGVGWILRDLSRRAGLVRVVRPHGLRHQAITRALDLTGGNVRAVARFSRHLDLKTVGRDDDAREDIAGAITRCWGPTTGPERGPGASDNLHYPK